MHRNVLLDGVLLDHPNTFRRLLEECAGTIRELRDDPSAYLKTILSTGGASNRRTALFRFGLALAILSYAIAFAVTLILWTTNRHHTLVDTNDTVIGWVPPHLLLPRVEQRDDEGLASGGGGGGHDRSTLPSGGQSPIYQLIPPIIAPTTQPTLNPPRLAVDETLFADPRFQPKREDLVPTGLPDAAPAPPSDGPGSNRGIGTGNEGGVGPGRGPGYGPGEGGNFGDGPYSIGGFPRRSLQQAPVDSKPVLTNNPRPFYTEEARKNKVQGVVKIRLLVGSDGQVKEVIVLSALSGGLTEQAIQAAYQMRFRPAMKDGHPVAYWVSNVLIEFNLR